MRETGDGDRRISGGLRGFFKIPLPPPPSPTPGSLALWEISVLYI